MTATLPVADERRSGPCANGQPLSYTALERVRCPRPVNKFRYVTDLCRGKNVLDLGALDETAVGVKEGTEYWLHGAIVEVAAEVIGVDNSSLIPADGLPTGPHSKIVGGNVYDLPSLDLPWQPDVVVAGELIEHVPNGLDFLARLRADERLRGSTLIVTTPNTTAVHNVIIGALSRESTHEDHLAVYSYKTLNTLFHRAGFTEYELMPYFMKFPEFISKNGVAARSAARGFQSTVNALEWLFPMLGGGWIARAQV